MEYAICVLHLRALEFGRKLPILHQFHWYDTHYYGAMNAKRSQMNELRHRMPMSCAEIARRQLKKKREVQCTNVHHK